MTEIIIAQLIIKQRTIMENEEKDSLLVKRLEDAEAKLRLAVLGLLNIYRSRDPIGIAKTTLKELGVDLDHKE